MSRPKLVFLGVLLAILGVYYMPFTTSVPTREMVYIPAGKFSMGSDDIEIFRSRKGEYGIKDELFLENERPVHELSLDGFFIDKYEVTNREYKLFCADTETPTPPMWRWNAYEDGKGDFPVTNVSWFDARRYCQWEEKRLPTEAEWERAARGPQGFRYPWGNEFSIEKANFGEPEKVAIGSIEADRSYYGVYDMAGNVMEFTDSWYDAYPGQQARSIVFGKIYKVLRGWFGGKSGHYHLPLLNSRTSARHYLIPEAVGENVGFRCARSGD